MVHSGGFLWLDQKDLVTETELTQKISSFSSHPPTFCMPHSSGTQWLSGVTLACTLFLKGCRYYYQGTSLIFFPWWYGASRQGEDFPEIVFLMFVMSKADKDTALFTSVIRHTVAHIIGTQSWFAPERVDILRHRAIPREKGNDTLLGGPSASPEHNLIITEQREKQWGKNNHSRSFLLLGVQMVCFFTARYWKALWKPALEIHKVESECFFWDLIKKGTLAFNSLATQNHFGGKNGRLPNTNSLVSVHSAQVSLGILHRGQFPHIAVVPPLGWPVLVRVFLRPPEGRGERRIWDFCVWPLTGWICGFSLSTHISYHISP